MRLLRGYCLDQVTCAYAECDYWGMPVPNFGDPKARLLIVGLCLRRTGPIVPGGCSRVTVAVIG